MTDAPLLLWLRRDLRLADNPALSAAAGSGAPVIPIFILDDEDHGDWRRGAASRWWLHHSLAALARRLEQHGSRLVLRRGPTAAAIDALIEETGARGVVRNRLYEPTLAARDTAIEAALTRRGLVAESHAASLLAEPWALATKAGGPFKVFTPFWRTLRSGPGPGPPLPAPRGLEAPKRWPRSEALEDWQLLPIRPDWSGGLRDAWTPGEAAARTRFAHFLDHALADYPEGRDRPDRDGSAALSPHLHFGEISPRQLWHATLARGAAEPALEGPAEVWLRELGWRDFAWHLLHHRPDMPDRPLDERFAHFPWRRSAKHLAAWQQGRTGYPLVDAGMRQLWSTGWMHNRVRMVVASFLIKDLRIDWRAGERWFWDTLVDADLGDNAMNWQWVAGCGADAAPFFRIFNPTAQARKFDPEGAYIRRWIPELADLPDEWIHEPWRAPEGRRGGYPAPIVDHAEARDAALAAFRSLPREG